MPARDVCEVGIGGPDLAVFILQHKQADRPIESRKRVGGDEQRSQRRVAENQQRGRTQLDPGIGGKLLLTDLDEKLDPLVRDVLLEPGNRFGRRRESSGCR